MIILLPDAKDGLKNLENNFSKIKLHEISNKMSQYHVTVKLPRFKLEQSLDLKETLTKVIIYLKIKHKSFLNKQLMSFIVAWMSNNVFIKGKLFQHIRR